MRKIAELNNPTGRDLTTVLEQFFTHKVSVLGTSKCYVYEDGDHIILDDSPLMDED